MQPLDDPVFGPELCGVVRCSHCGLPIVRRRSAWYHEWPGNLGAYHEPAPDWPRFWSR